MALSISGKKNRIKVQDFIGLAQHCGLSVRREERVRNRLFALKPQIEKRIHTSFLTEPYKSGLLEIFKERMKRIGL